MKVVFGGSAEPLVPRAFSTRLVMMPAPHGHTSSARDLKNGVVALA